MKRVFDAREKIRILRDPRQFSLRILNPAQLLRNELFQRFLVHLLKISLLRFYI